MDGKAALITALTVAELVILIMKNNTLNKLCNIIVWKMIARNHYYINLS
jgi:hypothetical protein